MSSSLARELGRCVRETGQALDRLGMRAAGDTSFRERFCRHRQIMNLFNKRPWLSNDAFVAPSAALIGDVTVSDKASVWYGCVVRGDQNSVHIGACTNVQDRAVLSTTKSLASGFPATLHLGNYVSIGHGSVLKSCTGEDASTVGMGCVLEEGSLVESNSILEAGSVLPAGARVPSGQVWGGSPAAYVRDVADGEADGIVKQAQAQADSAAEHAHEFLPYGTAYLDAERIRASGDSL